MSESSQRQILSKRQKMQCTRCNAIFDSDHEKKHMERHHSQLVKDGNTPAATPVVDKHQPMLSSFFLPSKSKAGEKST